MNSIAAVSLYFTVVMLVAAAIVVISVAFLVRAGLVARRNGRIVSPVPSPVVSSRTRVARPAHRWSSSLTSH